MNKQNRKSSNMDPLMLTDHERALLAVQDSGRFGDTLLRKVGGEMAHVTKREADIIDKYGEKGELFVMSQGSGTINPETGLKEYFLGKIVRSIGRGVSGAIQGAVDMVGDIGSGLGKMWDNTLGKHGLGGMIGDAFSGGDEADISASAKKIANEGFENVKSQGEKALGPEGHIMEKKGHELQGMQLQQAQQTEQAAEQTRNMVASQGFAGANPMQSIMNSQMGDMLQQSKHQQKAVMDAAVQEHDDALANLNQQKNSLLSNYMGATGEEFGSSSELSALEDYIAELKGEGA